MLQFRQSDTEAVLIVTLTELVSIIDPTFLFVFTHVLTKAVVTFTKGMDADESNYQARYNQFTINPSIFFAGLPVGEWHYKVYEQQSATNLDPAASGSVLEYGKLMIDRTTDFAFTMYNEPTTFKTYNG